MGRALTMVASAIALLLTPVGGAAHASVPHDRTVVRQLSQQGSYSTEADQTAQQISIPVPRGMTPTRVSGRLTFQNTGVRDTTGKVEFFADGVLVKTVEKTLTMNSTTVSFPVSRSALKSGDLTFQMQYLSEGVSDPGEVCTDPHLGTMAFDRVHVRLVGQERPPATLATFFSPSVRDVSVVVPTHPEDALRAAGLAAVASVAHIYTDQAQVSLTTASDQQDAVPVDGVGGRRIRIVPGTGPGRTRIAVEDGVPTLTVTGDPARLPGAAAALGSTYLPLADAARTTRLEQTTTPGQAETLTLAQLGQSSPSVQGLGVSQFIVGVKLSDFGRSVRSIDLHLVGQHAAIPPSVSAVLLYYWNGQLIGSQNLSNAGTAIDERLTVPATKLTQGNELTVKMVAIPAGSGSSTRPASTAVPFDCTGSLSVLPIEVDFDGKASTVSATPGQPFAPGFQRFPQSLDNVLTVAFGAANASDASLTDAGSLVDALQRLNTAELAVHVIPAAAFLDTSAPGLVVDATPAQASRLRAPLLMSSFRSIDAQNVRFGAGVTSPFAALEAFQSGGRDVLMLSSWAGSKGATADAQALEHHLAAHVARAPNGWYSLYDDLDVAQSLHRAPVIVQSAALSPQPQTVHRISERTKWAVIFVAVLLLAMLAQLWARARLRRRADRLVEAELQEYADKRKPQEP